MASVNKVILIGNVGRDPEIRTTQGGTKIASLSLATTEKWKDKSGEQKEKTEWHRVSVLNDRLVGVIERFVKKGSRLYLEGSLQTRKWTDKDGQERYTTEVVLTTFGSQLQLLDVKGGEAPAPARASKRQSSFDLDDEIPF